MSDDKSSSIDRVYTLLKHGCYQRTLHYHNTPKEYEELYRRQLDYVNVHYDIAGVQEVKEYLRTGIRKDRPSIVIGAFDGYRNQFDVLWRLLEERRMKAWYLLVSDFLDSSGMNQENLLTFYRMQWFPEEYADGRYAMSWEEALEVSRNHIIVNHSSTHYLLTEKTEEKTLEYEIVHSHKMLEEKLGISPEIFSWLGGAGLEQNVQAENILRQNGYHLLMGYRMEYFDDRDGRFPVWEEASPDRKCMSRLDKEIRRYEQVMGNIGWYSAVPAILLLCQSGHLITDGETEEDVELAGHFAALAQHLMRSREMNEDSAAQQALDIIAVNRIGEGFFFH